MVLLVVDTQQLITTPDETQLILFGGAENMLKRCGVKLKNLDIKKMQEEYDALNTCREELKGRYKSVEKEVAEARKQITRELKI